MIRTYLLWLIFLFQIFSKMVFQKGVTKICHYLFLSAAGMSRLRTAGFMHCVNLPIELNSSVLLKLTLPASVVNLKWFNIEFLLSFFCYLLCAEHVSTCEGGNPAIWWWSICSHTHTSPAQRLGTLKKHTATTTHDAGYLAQNYNHGALI